MTRIDSNRAVLTDMLRSVPFQSFALNMENGDRIVIEHPENIAFDSTENGRNEIYIISNRLRLFTTFIAIASIAQLDHPDPRLNA